MPDAKQPSRSTDELGYNEFNMIGLTIMRYQPELQTQFERAVAMAFVARAKSEAYGNDRGEVSYRTKCGNLGDPAIERALEGGYEQFREQVTMRVLQGSRDRLKLNRCGACNRIVGTPEAKWCKWCKFDWH